MKEEDELFNQIIHDSKSKILVLKLLSNFFNHQQIVAVLIRTKVIHNLFEKNRLLDINKLDLFHIQYTSSFIDLFQKLKKSKEKQYSLISDEIHINDDFIEKLKLEVGETKFLEQTRAHSQNMSQKLQHLYRLLSDEKVEEINWETITDFSNKLKNEFFREIAIEQYEQLACLNRNMYLHRNIQIEKKLLGRLNIFKFRVKFLCGLICNNEVIEVFEFIDSNDKFVFVNNDKWFYLINDIDAKGIDISRNNSSKNLILNSLKNKNQELIEKLEKVKTSLPKEVLSVLNEYAEKISSMDFLEELQNVDEQTNILKTMLNINIK